MKFKLSILTLVLLASTGTASATGEGVSMAEYQAVKAGAICAYIGNMTTPRHRANEVIAQLFEDNVIAWKAVNGRMLPYEYNPAPATLASDYAVFYQQSTADTADEMDVSLKSQGLSYSPESWQTVAAQFWDSRNCDSVVKSNR